jgi:hypothetical protein
VASRDDVSPIIIATLTVALADPGRTGSGSATTGPSRQDGNIFDSAAGEFLLGAGSV